MKERLLIFILLFMMIQSPAQQGFVTRKGQQFFLAGHPYNYIGTNYWYGGLLYDSPVKIKRLRSELDFLVNKGVTNLRIMGGAEGAGPINGTERVTPALHSYPDVFDDKVMQGLDLLLAEMGKRRMKAVIYLSNNWEWSGGFLQYLNWNELIPDSILQRKLSWDEMRDYVSRFYSCTNCMRLYRDQVRYIIGRTNSITHKKYLSDPTIMSWELANEPRPMRPAVIPAFKAWVSSTAAFIKSLDRQHLVTIGSEGVMGSENIDVFRAIHEDSAVDYATIHIWPKNWSWFRDTSIEAGMTAIIEKTKIYLDQHMSVAAAINKPLVAEEFGLPRDDHSFALEATTYHRDRFYQNIFITLAESISQRGSLAGVNFWTFGGSGRPSGKTEYWQAGDDLIGDPPQEEQGLNSVFDSDKTTWKLIELFTKKLNKPHDAKNL